MKWAVFNNSNLIGCNFDQARMFHVKTNHTVLDSSKFRGANMFGMEGHHASFVNCDFSHALMKDVEFLESDFEKSTALKVRFIRAVLIGSNLDSTDLCYSDFTGAGLEGATFRNARIWGANFQGAHLQGADFSGADLKDCNFFGAEFESTNFENAINIPDDFQKLIIDDHFTGVCDVRHIKH